MSIISNMATISPRVTVATGQDHTNATGQVDDELAEDTLRLVGGGMIRREVYVDISYDDSGEPSDVIYIDIAY